MTGSNNTPRMKHNMAITQVVILSLNRSLQIRIKRIQRLTTIRFLRRSNLSRIKRRLTTNSRCIVPTTPNRRFTLRRVTIIRRVMSNNSPNFTLRIFYHVKNGMIMPIMSQSTKLNNTSTTRNRTRRNNHNRLRATREFRHGAPRQQRTSTTNYL